MGISLPFARTLAALVLILSILSLPSSAPAQGQDDPLPSPPILLRVVALTGDPSQLCASDSLAVQASSCGPCVAFTAASRPGGVPTFEADVRLDSCIAAVCLPESRRLPIGSFAAGSYSLRVVTIRRFISASGIRADSSEQSVEFEVGPCIEPPPSDSLPYDLRTCVGPLATTGACADEVCPEVSVPFTVTGVFPSGCYRVRRFELLPLGAPIDVVQLSVLRCSEGCTRATLPFSATVMLPPAAPGERRFQLRIVENDCTDSSGTGLVWSADRRYRVRESCGPPEACVFPVMTAASTQLCAAILSPAGDAAVDFALQSSVVVAGLEGEIEVQEPLVVDGVEAIGVATGMRALWQRTEHGARWALLGFDGQQLPALGGERVLRVKVSVPTDGPLPERMRVGVGVSVASDSVGGDVPLCDISWIRFADPAAIVCARRSCDVNGDGVDNVRDLVAMVHCLRSPGTCPDSLPRPDCNADSTFDLDDVLCCARRILRGMGTDTLPPRPGDGLSLRFGTPLRGSDGVELPLTLEGRETLGDARLVLAFPGDRFEFEAATFEGDESGWLTIAEAREPGRVTLALVNVGGGERTLSLRLFLRLRPGAQPEGAVTVDESELRGVDGARLTTVIAGTASAALGEAASRPLGLSLARPNPFGSTTRFSVTLVSEADAEVAVHDLAGRRVALLHRGRLSAGSHDLIWDGRGERGTRVAGGLYFVRLRVAGDVASRSVVVLGPR